MKVEKTFKCLGGTFKSKVDNVALCKHRADKSIDLPQVYFQRAHGRHTALREIYLQDPAKRSGEIDLLVRTGLVGFALL